MAPANADRDFVKKATSYTIVPASSHPNLADLLANPDEDVEDDGTTLLPISQRSMLFFGRSEQGHLLTSISYTHAQIGRREPDRLSGIAD